MPVMLLQAPEQFGRGGGLGIEIRIAGAVGAVEVDQIRCLECAGIAGTELLRGRQVIGVAGAARHLMAITIVVVITQAGRDVVTLLLKMPAAVDAGGIAAIDAVALGGEVGAIGIQAFLAMVHPQTERAEVGVEVVAQADLVVMLGASMGPDYTRFRDPELIRPGDQTLVQIDVDPRNAGWVYPVDMAVTGDVGDVLAMLAEIGLSPENAAARTAHGMSIKKKHKYFDLPDLPSAQGTVHHTDVVRGLQDFLGPKDLVALDAGAQRIWATFGLRTPYPGQLLVPGGTGVMGWGGPAAAAAKIVRPEKRVTCLSGDGGFMMTVQVLPTAVQQNLDVVFLVSNNAGLGMVRDNLGDKQIAVDFNDVDFAKVSEGMGAKGMSVYHPGEIRDALEEAHKMGGPVVIDVKVDPAASHHEAVDNAPL